jgi:NOL1/NOP2/fmu family ribosome biogenesis protein
MTLHILSEKEKKEILDELEEQFGILEILGIVVKRGEERLFLFQGSFTENQIKELDSTVPIERVGIYFAKISEGHIRLSIDGIQILKNQITKNVVEINLEDVEKWMQGSELQITTGKKGYIIIKYKNDFLGTGKASENKITNFIPKNRRLKYKDQ